MAIVRPSTAPAGLCPTVRARDEEHFSMAPAVDAVSSLPHPERAARRQPGEQSRDAPSLDWFRIETALNEGGYAVVRDVLTANECAALAARYDDDAQFRSRIVMARHNFGRGEYKYFAYPLPEPV
ncbi:MAG TPA: hypothetical protein VH020_15820, partial [Stellaceae bacterium]|nr:hypothetical protein [Stellaceae bacterium]